MVKNFTGQRKNLTSFKEQVYQIFFQSTSDPEKWLGVSISKRLCRTDNRLKVPLMRASKAGPYEGRKLAFHCPMRPSICASNISGRGARSNSLTGPTTKSN